MSYILMALVVVLIVLRDIKRKKMYDNKNMELQEYRQYSRKHFDNQLEESKRIKNSKIIFTRRGPVENLYVDDRLQHSHEIVLFDSDNAIENYFVEGRCENLLRADTRKIGYIRIGVYPDKPIANISHIGVHKEYRRNKYATLMMQRVIEWAKLSGIKELKIHAAASGEITQKDLISFYESFGFIDGGYGYMSCILEENK